MEALVLAEFVLVAAACVVLLLRRGKSDGGGRELPLWVWILVAVLWIPMGLTIVSIKIGWVRIETLPKGLLEVMLAVALPTLILFLREHLRSKSATTFPSLDRGNIEVGTIRVVIKTVAATEPDLAGPEAERLAGAIESQLRSFTELTLRVELRGVRRGSVVIDLAVLCWIVQSSWAALGGYEKAEHGFELLKKALKEDWSKYCEKIGGFLVGSEAAEVVVTLKSSEQIDREIADLERGQSAKRIGGHK